MIAGSLALRCLLAWSALAAAIPPPPSALARYFKDGKLEPGDYSWLRGAFADAAPADAAAYRAVLAWRSACFAADKATTRAELATFGITAPAASVDHIPYRTLLCGQVASLPEPLDLHDWPGFTRDVAVVRPIAQAYFAATAAAEQSVNPEAADLRDALLARPVGEQTLRRGFGWAGDESADGPNLSARQRGILAAMMAVATQARDRANTDWLKGVAARQGWPTRSQVGEAASHEAWLLVQHADTEPAFQIRVLRLMQPLVARHEVTATDYAYLYDRTMLVVTGRQRYGTQLTCRGGKYVPRPLEDEAAMDGRRKEVGMDPFATYAVEATRILGACHDSPGDDSPLGPRARAGQGTVTEDTCPCPTPPGTAPSSRKPTTRSSVGALPASPVAVAGAPA